MVAPSRILRKLSSPLLRRLRSKVALRSEPVIRNDELKHLYADFLRTKETDGVTMLHREDLYAPGPPITVPSTEMLELAAKYADTQILDVGCGLGIYSRELAKKGFSCVGIETNVNYVNEAGRYIEAHHMSAEELRFQDKTFDTAIMFEVLEHLGNPEKALREIARVVRKNLILSVPNVGPLVDCVEHNVIMHHFFETTHCNFFTKPMLERLLGKVFPHLLVREFGQFFNISGKRLFYHLSAVASFADIEL